MDTLRGVSPGWRPGAPQHIGGRRLGQLRGLPAAPGIRWEHAHRAHPRFLSTIRHTQQLSIFGSSGSVTITHDCDCASPSRLLSGQTPQSPSSSHQHHLTSPTMKPSTSYYSSWCWTQRRNQSNRVTTQTLCTFIRTRPTVFLCPVSLPVSIIQEAEANKNPIQVIYCMSYPTLCQAVLPGMCTKRSWC